MMEVPEEIVKQACEMIKLAGETDNNFVKVLEAGELIRQKGMTPIYFLHEETMFLEVVVKETLDKKKLH